MRPSICYVSIRVGRLADDKLVPLLIKQQTIQMYGTVD
jgi:hypothetical protein